MRDALYVGTRQALGSCQFQASALVLGVIEKEETGMMSSFWSGRFSEKRSCLLR